MKWIRQIVIILFIIVIALPVPLSLIFYKSNNENENREKAQFPAAISDGVFQEIDAWFNDRSPFREAIISNYSRIDNKVEKSYLNWLASLIYGDGEAEYDFVYDDGIGENPPIIEDYDSILPYPYLDTGNAYYPVKTNGLVLYGREDWLFYTIDNAIAYYTGANAKENDEMLEAFNLISDVCELIKERGIEFRILILPNKEQVYSDKMPTFEIVHPAKIMQRLRYYLKSKGSNCFVYPLEPLIGGRKGGRNTYYQQDTHWNSYGAMIGLMALMSTFGEKIEDFSLTYKQHQGGDIASSLGYDGELYVTNEVVFRNEITLNEEKLDDRKNHNATIKYTSTAQSGKNCVVVGDSFRMALVPLLGKLFDQTISCHDDNIELVRDYIMSLNPGDYLILENVERYYTKSFGALETIKTYYS